MMKQLLMRFYLDYVGCKVYTSSFSSSDSLVFYLDYVGCKVGDIFEEEGYIEVLSRLCGM